MCQGATLFPALYGHKALTCSNEATPVFLDIPEYYSAFYTESTKMYLHCLYIKFLRVGLAEYAVNFLIITLDYCISICEERLGNDNLTIVLRTSMIIPYGSSPRKENEKPVQDPFVVPLPRCVFLHVRLIMLTKIVDPQAKIQVIFIHTFIYFINVYYYHCTHLRYKCQPQKYSVLISRFQALQCQPLHIWCFKS